MTIALLILLVVLITLATWRSSAQRRDASPRTPVHPYLRHLADDPEVRRDWRQIG
jgi:hypothetical protein